MLPMSSLGTEMAAFGSSTYPTFNVAASAICVGVIPYTLSSITAPKVAVDQR
jgi:lipoprotein signal peptidase